MKSLKDFKERMKPGAKVNSKLFYLKNGEWVEQNCIVDRVCTVSNNRHFGLTASIPGKTSYCDWPLRTDLNIVNENTVEILFFRGEGKLIYEFVN